MPAANRAVGVPVELGIVVGMEIHKPGGDDEPAGIDHLGSVAGIETADFGDLAILNADIRAVARHARAIDDRAVFNNGIKLRHMFPSFVGLLYSPCVAAK